MANQSKNMNYIFNKEYFSGLKKVVGQKDKVEFSLPDTKEKNKRITKFRFDVKQMPTDAWQMLDGYQGFVLKTVYPGLIIGSGNPHELNAKEVIKCGFTFDYVTGVPYLPGSSLKGTLRSFFPGQYKREDAAGRKDYILSLLGMNENQVDIADFEENIFENGDIFLGAVPKTGGELLEMEYITPHKPFKNPNPINIIKIKGNTPIQFHMVLSDYKVGDKVIVSAAEKKELFKKIVLDMGVGAKTNVGFGNFTE